MDEKEDVAMNILKTLRAERGLSVRDLAEKSGVSWTTIHALETDKRKGNLATIGKIANGLGVDFKLLLPLTDETILTPNTEKNNRAA